MKLELCELLDRLERVAPTNRSELWRLSYEVLVRLGWTNEYGGDFDRSWFLRAPGERRDTASYPDVARDLQEAIEHALPPGEDWYFRVGVTAGPDRECWVVVARFNERTGESELHDAGGLTPAAVLCAAALRARESQDD